MCCRGTAESQLRAAEGHEDIWRPEDLQFQPRDFSKWRTASQKKRHALSMSAHSAPWTSLPGVLKGLPNCPRIRDVLDVAWASRRSALPLGGIDECKKDFWVNPSQAVQREPWGNAPPLLCQCTMPYSFEMSTGLSGLDMLHLQGFPTSATVAPTHMFDDKMVRSLAGEGFFLPVATGIAYAYYLNPWAPWWGGAGKAALAATHQGGCSSRSASASCSQ